MHKKLDLFKNFAKAVNRVGCGFCCLKQNFFANFEAKLKSVMFVEPQTQKLMN